MSARTIDFEQGILELAVCLAAQLTHARSIDSTPLGRAMWARMRSPKKGDLCLVTMVSPADQEQWRRLGVLLEKDWQGDFNANFTLRNLSAEPSTTTWNNASLVALPTSLAMPSLTPPRDINDRPLDPMNRYFEAFPGTWRTKSVFNLIRTLGRWPGGEG